MFLNLIYCQTKNVSYVFQNTLIIPNLTRICRLFSVRIHDEDNNQCCNDTYSVSSSVKPSVTNGPPWKIMFFGSDNFAVKCLEALYSEYQIGKLISKLHVTVNFTLDWYGKHNEVYRYAQEKKLGISEWPSKIENIENKYDFGVVVSFRFLIPEIIISSFPMGILNVHGSLLPKWRGPAPIIHAILNGDTETGITIIRINSDKFDTGDIVKRYAVPIKRDETAVELTSRMAVIGGQVLVDCIQDLPRSLTLAIPQSGEGVSYAKKITSSMASVDWKNKSAQDIFNQYRALSPKLNLKTHWFGIIVHVLDDVQLDEVEKMNPENCKSIANIQTKMPFIYGLVEFSRKRALLRVQCGDGKWILIRRVLIHQKQLTAVQFYNGYISKIENSLQRRFITLF